MPFLKIQTNQSLQDTQQQQLLSDASQLVASELGKPENYVMVAIEPPIAMSFAGSTEPTAYLELKSIGLPENKTKDLSSALCSLITQTTNKKVVWTSAHIAIATPFFLKRNGQILIISGPYSKKRMVSHHVNS